MACTRRWQWGTGGAAAGSRLRSWAALLTAEPGLVRRVPVTGLDAVLVAIADMADLKSAHLAGHSRGVANLAAEAGRDSGLADEEVSALRRAGLLHDLGRLGVSSGIWDKPGSLTETEFERVRLHPYLTDRMLARIPALSRIREIAARHHERLDGSGYPRGLTAALLTPPDLLLAAADVYHALTEPRPHRPPLDAGHAADELRDQVRRQRTRCCAPPGIAHRRARTGRAASPAARWRCFGCSPAVIRTSRSHSASRSARRQSPTTSSTSTRSSTYPAAPQRHYSRPSTV
jgi:hypothetical protein